ncbi:hypothetical protein HA402_013401 [Bradysia odoriphaga]|nr:hypothetical protein HA402_013401 [Bradysia odoriphaga]
MISSRRVGGGTAGCVLAGRLSKEYDLGSVLLLEAGGSPPPAAVVPHFAEVVGLDPDINNFFNSVPMTNASLKNGGIVINHTGKMLGGSGSHNEMVHSRGSPKDFDNWAEITGDESWTYANVLQYFKKSETFVAEQYGNENLEDFYGTNGPLTIDSNHSPMIPMWFEAGRELGFESGDPNGFQKEGFTTFNMAINKGRRSSTYSEYVENWEKNPLNNGKLTVIRYATVNEVLMDENNRAYGVTYNRHGIPQIAHASKEIILSAGAFQSPMILMKSGIGPADVLQEAGIPVKVALEAVGKDISEHVSVTLPFVVNDTTPFIHVNANETEIILENYHNGYGVLATRHEGAQCFIRSSKAEPDWPDVWIASHPTLAIDNEPQVVRMYVVLGRPQSRGEYTMNTTAYKDGIRDDEQLALIDYKLMTHDDDVDAMIEGIKMTFNIMENTNSFRDIDATYAESPEEACNEFEYRSDAYWKCYIQQNTISWIHMVGTCRMGPDSDTSNDSVVDSKLRVRGVENLRIIDASIMPAVTNANINAPIVMIAEKAAHEISRTWTLK